jgi:hypothetical protein
VPREAMRTERRFGAHKRGSGSAQQHCVLQRARNDAAGFTPPVSPVTLCVFLITILLQLGQTLTYLLRDIPEEG